MIAWIDAGRDLGRLIRSQWHPLDRLEGEQTTRLRAQLAHARATVPFYRERADDTWRDVERGAAPLHALPLVRRADVQAELQGFLSESGERRLWRRSHTSGSTGRPLESAFDPRAWHQSKYAFKLRRLVASGWRPGQRIAIVEAAAPDALRDAAPEGARAAERWLHPRRFVSVFEPPEAHLDTYASYRPHYIYAFPSYLGALLPLWAELRLGTDRKARIPLRALMTSGEWLSPQLRQRLEEGFGVPVLDVYGSTEFKEVAWQCPERTGYHVNMESVWTEIVDADGAPVPPGTPGEVVITSLINRAMPLIRYATGDRAMQRPGRCACGRGSIRLDRFEGRTSEIVELPDGRSLSPYALTTAVERCPGLVQFRIVQRARDRLDVWVVLRGAERESLERLRFALSQVVGPDVELCLHSVPALPRDRSGKCSAVSRAPAGELRGAPVCSDVA